MATSDARAARERKQRIFVVVGAVVLLALLAFQLPKLLGGSGTETAAPAAGTTAGGETEPGTQGTTALPVALVDTDRPLALGPGQFRSFTLFEPKDPFVQQIASAEPEIGTGSATGDGAAQAPKKARAPSRSFSVGAAAAGATILSVNGVRHVLEPGGFFPSSDPVFVLVSEQPGTKTVAVGLRGGKYENGERRTTLRVGKPVVIVNSTTGARYRLVLVTAGDGKPKAPAKNQP